jgi:hypothetical protein
MKKVTFLIVLISLLLNSNIFAGSANAFEYNSNKVRSELSNLDLIDTFVEANDISYIDLTQTNTSMASTLTYGQTGAFGIQILEPPLGIPSIVWGACGNIGGVALVYFITEDKEETKKAAYGCIGGMVLVAGCWVGYIFLVIGASTL